MHRMAIHSSIARGKTQTNPRSRSGWTLAWLAAAALTALGQLGVSCSKDVARGGVGQDCYPNGTCNAGLSCYSNLCVDARTGAGGSGGGGGAGERGNGRRAAWWTGGGARGVGGAPGGWCGEARGGAGQPAVAQGGGIAGDRVATAGSAVASAAAAAVSAVRAAASAAAPVASAVRQGRALAVWMPAAIRAPASSSMPAPARPRGRRLRLQPDHHDRLLRRRRHADGERRLTNAPASSLMDAFYLLDPTNTSVALEPCPYCLRYNRSSEAACVCSTSVRPTSHPVRRPPPRTVPAVQSRSRLHGPAGPRRRRPRAAPIRDVRLRMQRQLRNVGGRRPAGRLRQLTSRVVAESTQLVVTKPIATWLR